MLLQLQVEVRVREAALSPMLFDDDIPRAWREVGVKFRAPCSFLAQVTPHDAALARVDVVPVFVIPFFPLAMRNDENRNIRRARSCLNGAQVVEQAHLLRDLPDPRPEEALLGQEVVVRIDEQHRRRILAILREHHAATAVPWPRAWRSMLAAKSGVS